MIMSNFLWGRCVPLGFLLFAFAGMGLSEMLSTPVLAAARRVEMRAGAFRLFAVELFDI
ncbi:hypothetical protein [Paraburkholderia sp. BL23I1N1]|uniref:hypothetical protein n=1 Tax=Paraburkholderia sp. BL23I1N1 TaxID=1938802 RepID=UPI00160102A0|nr:hypothetical protein [Paraburkholderia sp. BL23I1N1]